MEYPFNRQQWKEILARLYKRASVDHQFHVLCTRDAHAAIKLICGHDIPKNIGVRFEPQHTDEIVLVLPKEYKEQLHPFHEKDFDHLAEGMAAVCQTFSSVQESAKL